MNTITLKVDYSKSLMQLFKRKTVRLPRKKKKQQKKKLRDFLLEGQNNILHYPKTGSTFVFYWYKNRIKMKTFGEMTLAIKTKGTTAKAIQNKKVYINRKGVSNENTY